MYKCTGFFAFQVNSGSWERGGGRSHAFGNLVRNLTRLHDPPPLPKKTPPPIYTYITEPIHIQNLLKADLCISLYTDLYTDIGALVFMTLCVTMHGSLSVSLPVCLSVHAPTFGRPKINLSPTKTKPSHRRPFKKGSWPSCKYMSKYSKGLRLQPKHGLWYDVIGDYTMPGDVRLLYLLDTLASLRFEHRAKSSTVIHL